MSKIIGEHKCEGRAKAAALPPKHELRSLGLKMGKNNCFALLGKIVGSTVGKTIIKTMVKFDGYEMCMASDLELVHLAFNRL